MLKEILCFTAIFGLCQSAVVDQSSRLATQNRYNLYTQSQPFTPVTVYDPPSIQAAFIEDAPVVIIVHGHLNDAAPNIDQDLIFEILTHHDFNVISADWSAVAIAGYDFASGAVPSIAQHLSTFIQNVILAGFTYADIRLIGYDLGAHVCGHAGRMLEGQISYITGLNPRGNDWTEARRPLARGDAQVVEVIHTNNFFGIDSPIGNIDFFINGGRVQPGCANHPCHHNRAIQIMTASIAHTIDGNLCSTFAEVRANTCRGRTLRVGSLDFKIGAGIYRANTRNIYPF